MREKAIRVGLIGAGTIGRVHAMNIAGIREVELVAVADPVQLAANKIAAEVGIPNVFDDYQSLLKDERITCVLICSPPITHAMIVEEAANKGKHIFCEKPLALSLDEADKALASVEKAGVKLQVGYNRRFDPSFRRARELLQHGVIGNLHLVRITSRDPDIPNVEYLRTCGGLFFDTTSHDFDMMRYLTADEAEEIFAVGGELIDPKLRELGDIDTAVVLLRLRSGAFGIVENSRRAAYGYDQRVELFGSGGMIEVMNHLCDQTVLSNKDGRHLARNKWFFQERYRESFVNEIFSFFACIKEDKEPEVTGFDGRMAIAMAVAAKRSLIEHRPVSLTEVLGKVSKRGPE
jgi:myo-inositol 2-dehydrogenase/D-chiro-inositol 1-dehydrogenase